MTWINAVLGLLGILGKIFLFGILTAVIMLVFIIMREVAWMTHEENKKKLEEKKDHDDESV